MWGCFLMSGVKILHFLKDWWKSIPIHQNYTMALNPKGVVKRDEYNYYIILFIAVKKKKKKKSWMLWAFHVQNSRQVLGFFSWMTH